MSNNPEICSLCFDDVDNCKCLELSSNNKEVIKLVNEIKELKTELLALKIQLCMLIM